MGNFLDNLKNAVDNGEFNSEAAKKIIDIDKLADEKKQEVLNSGKTLEELVKERLDTVGIRTVSEEDAAILNSEYEKKMNEIKKQDIINMELITLNDAEMNVSNVISDFLSGIVELKTRFQKEIDEKNPMFEELSKKIKEIELKYSIFNT